MAQGLCKELLVKDEHLCLQRQKFAFEAQLQPSLAALHIWTRRRLGLCTWFGPKYQQSFSRYRSQERKPCTIVGTFRHRPQSQWTTLAPSRTRHCARPPLSPCSPRSSQPPMTYGYLPISCSRKSLLGTFRPCEKLKVFARCSTLAPSAPPPIIRLCFTVSYFDKLCYNPPPSTRISRRSCQCGFPSTKLNSVCSREFSSRRRDSGLW